MQLIKKITTKFNDIIDHHNLRHHISEKSDRVVLYNAASTISNLVFALIKLTIGIFFLSLWFLIFGGYYIILLAIRSYFLWRYRQIRVSNINPLEREKLKLDTCEKVVSYTVYWAWLLLHYRFICIS